MSYYAINENLSSITTQAPENLSDCEEESKYSENLKLKIEGINSNSCKSKEFQPLSNKGEPLSPHYKWQAKMAKIHPFRNLIFNPCCPKELLQEHLRKVCKSLNYCVYHLEKPKGKEPSSRNVCLAEILGTNFFSLIIFDFVFFI